MKQSTPNKGDKFMNGKLLAIIAFLVLGGCASFEEAYHLDREFGEANRAAWERQIAYPDRRVETAPEGMEGITAEKVIGVHIDTYDREPTKVDVFSIGIMGQ
jgi:DNA-binding sugar fermentation-stimulating protein